MNILKSERVCCGVCRIQRYGWNDEGGGEVITDKQRVWAMHKERKWRTISAYGGPEFETAGRQPIRCHGAGRR
jgi:hypothetical protein